MIRRPRAPRLGAAPWSGVLLAGSDIDIIIDA